MGIENIKTVLKNKNRKLTLKSPIIGASGTYGYNVEFEDFIDLDCLGAISTKGITLEARMGNDGNRIFETHCGMINRIGLENVGIKRFIEEKLPILKEKNIDFLLNIAGSTIEEYTKLAQIAQKHNIKAIEVNVSCPNVQSGCIEFGLNPELLYKLISQIRQNYDGFLIVKLSPNTDDITCLAKAVYNAEADCISAINTLRGLGVELKQVGNKFIKSFVQGGLSGECVKHVALYMVNQIRNVVDIPIIAIGGISNLNDLLEFIAVGADAFQIGTANFKNPSVCTSLAKELSEFIAKNNFKNFDELIGAINGK